MFNFFPKPHLSAPYRARLLVQAASHDAWREYCPPLQERKAAGAFVHGYGSKKPRSNDGEWRDERAPYRMRARHRRILAAASIAALAIASPALATPYTGPEEFVGPFADWLNVTSYGAAGNGANDDTTAIQKAINALSSSRPTLYLPAPVVCYKITRTLTFNAKAYMRIIGASPSTTPICWRGSSGGTMMAVNGSRYSTIGRLTFNGENSASVLINQSWDGKTGNFDTENQYPDVVFENAGTGLYCGFSGHGCAETSMLRDRFSSLTAGVSLGNFNALDMWIWYGTFTNNTDGVTNSSGAGNFHVYNSNFTNSAEADLKIYNTGGFDFRWNYSINAGQFLLSYNVGGNYCNINLQGNAILDTSNGDGESKNGTSVQVGCLGPVVAIDNVFRSLSGVAGPVIDLIDGSASLFSMGNTFTIPATAAVPGEYLSVLDTVVSRSSVNPTAPMLPEAPPNNGRVITEETSSRTSSQIQRDINSAATSGDVRRVIHLRAGTYTRMKLTIPANSDIQIIGDGYYTQLQGDGTDPVISGAGPLMATLRDFQVNGEGGPGISVSGVDQTRARIFMEGVNVSRNTTNVSINGLANACIEAHDFIEGEAGNTSIVATGPLSVWNGACLNIFAGASSGNPSSYQISNGAHVSVFDTWYDNGAGGNRRLSATGGGAVTFFGGTAAEGGSGAPAFSLNNFTGNAALVGGGVSGGGISFSGSGASANDLVLGMLLGSAASSDSITANPPFDLWLSAQPVEHRRQNLPLRSEQLS